MKAYFFYNNRKSILKKLEILIVFSILLLAIFNLGLPIVIDIIISLFLLIFIKKILQSILFFSILSIVVLVTSHNYEQNKISEMFFSPHEILKRGNHYLQNQDISFDVPFGNLSAMSDRSSSKYKKDIEERRTIKFITDKNGFRNDRDITNAEYIVAGDSFANGNGTSQEYIPSVQLKNKMNKNIALLAYPGQPVNYRYNLIKFYNQYGDNSSILLFYFEGNDFFQKNIIRDIQKPVSNDNLLIDIKNIIKKMENYKSKLLTLTIPKNDLFIRKIRRKTQNFYNYIFDELNENKDQVTIKRIKGINVAFFNDYFRTSKLTNPTTYIIKDKFILKKIKAVYFVPTKYRVYSDYFSESNIIPSKSFSFLKKQYDEFNIPVFNLTQALKKEAQKIIFQKKFVFYKDDTHWNKIGINVAMSFVKKSIDCIEKKSVDACK